MKILNLTQHTATTEQITAGVIELPQEKKAELVKYLTFDVLPSGEEILTRCDKICSLAKSFDIDSVMIGGAPFLMGPLERSLVNINIYPYYSFSLRVSNEKIIDGKTVKTSEFKHVGFVLSTLVGL